MPNEPPGARVAPNHVDLRSITLAAQRVAVSAVWSSIGRHKPNAARAEDRPQLVARLDAGFLFLLIDRTIFLLFPAPRPAPNLRHPLRTASALSVSRPGGPPMRFAWRSLWAAARPRRVGLSVRLPKRRLRERKQPGTDRPSRVSQRASGLAVSGRPDLPHDFGPFSMAPSRSGFRLPAPRLGARATRIPSARQTALRLWVQGPSRG